MKTIKVSEATSPALDWLVAKCEGILDPVHGEPQPRVVFYSDQWDRYMRLNPPPQVYYSDRYEPSTDWAQGGPIIEREHIAISWVVSNYLYVTGCWSAHIPQTNGKLLYAPTPLIAAMRCYCCSKLGDEVEVPDELIKEIQP